MSGFNSKKEKNSRKIIVTHFILVVESNEH